MTLNVCSGHTHRFSCSIQVRIRELHTRTLSCTMLVDIVDTTEGLPSRAFLKLYDRRFADQLRRDYKLKEWTASLEQTYVQSVQNGTVVDFLHKLHNVPNFQDDTEDDWDDAQNELYLADELFTLFKAEVAAYDALHEQQGKSVPNLLAAVNLGLHPGSDLVTESDATHVPANSPDFHPFQVKGILLQYIDGFSLRHVPERCPRSTWQDTVNKAVDIVRLMGDYNILNRDMRPDNFIVSPSSDRQDDQPYRVYMIDFGLCRIRGTDETGLEWGRAKSTKDEEGAVGLIMQMILKRDYGFELEYESSGRYDEWGDTDESLPEGTVRVEVAPGEWQAIIPGVPTKIQYKH